jgi:hypothetical protein
MMKMRQAEKNRFSLNRKLLPFKKKQMKKDLTIDSMLPNCFDLLAPSKWQLKFFFSIFGYRVLRRSGMFVNSSYHSTILKQSN